MDAQDAIDLGREAIRTCLMIGGPILVVSLIVSLALGIVQAITQVQDQTVSFVPKLLLVLVAIAAGLPWLSDHLVDFSQDMFGKPMLMANLPEAPTERAAFLPASYSQAPPVSPASVRPTVPNHLAPSTDWKLLEQPATAPKSPFQLPHYRFSKKLTDDLEG